LSSAAISDYLTRVVQPLLATVDGVASADILGGQTFAMRLWLDPARMAARGYQQATFLRQFAPITSNRRRARPKATSRSPTSIRYRARQCRAVHQDGGQGEGTAAVVRMEDIGTVDLNAQSWTSSIEMNGQHAVFIWRPGDPTGNPLSLVGGYPGAVARNRAQPAVVIGQMQVAYDSTKFIQASIDEVQFTLAAAVVIVSLAG